jgi:hypothetical protein
MGISGHTSMVNQIDFEQDATLYHTEISMRVYRVAQIQMDFLYL